MRKQDFCDTFRNMHPTNQEYTWSNGEATTRIDYIWISEGLASGLQKAEIEEAEEVTKSDQKIIRAEIWIKHMIALNSKTEVRKRRQSRTLYLYDQAKEENWKSYAQELQKRLEIKGTLKLIKEIRQCNNEETDKMNNIWDIIEEVIIIAASKHLPKKKIYNTVLNRRGSQKDQQQEKNIVKIQRLIKYTKTREGKETTEKEKGEVNDMLKTLGKKEGAKLPKLQRQWSKAWIENMKGWQKLLQGKRKRE